MVSSKDQSKKISQGLRQSSKKFFEEFYAKEEQAGRHPTPLEAALALGRIFNQITEEDGWLPQPPDRPEVPAEVFEPVISRFSQEAYHEAVEAWYRHTPGLEIEKAERGCFAGGMGARRKSISSNTLAIHPMPILRSKNCNLCRMAKQKRF